MTASLIPSHHVGDIVEVDPIMGRKKDRGVLYRVTAVPGGSRKRLEVEPVDGGALLSGPPEAFIKVDAERERDARARIDAREAAGGAPTLGSVVRWSAQPSKGHGSPLFVVLAVDAGKAKIAVFGGNEGRYYAKVPTSQLTVIPISDEVRAVVATGIVGS